MKATRNTPAAENWLPVPGFPLYEVSDLGQVRSHARGKPKMLRQQISGRGGYPHVNLHDGKGHTLKIHTLVLLAFVGPRPEGLVSRHYDGNPRNNTLGNLLYGTHEENFADQKRHGTNARTLKTHCPRGHEYTPSNTKMSAGSRSCRTCSRKQGRDAYTPKPRKDRLAKTHCKKGHPYDGTISSNGSLTCKPCHNAWNRAAFAKKMAARQESNPS